MLRLRLSRHFPLPLRAASRGSVRHGAAKVAIPAALAVLLAGCEGSLDSANTAAVFPAGPQLSGVTTASTATTDSTPKASATSAAAEGATAPPKPRADKASADKTPSDMAGMSPAKAAEALMAAGTPGTTAYKIGPQDVLELSVFKVTDLSRVVQVADSGTANFPLVGEVQVVGRTAQDVERDLTKKLGAKYLQNPQVTVFVKEYNSQRVTIEGAVKKPGVYPIRGRNTLLQFIAMAEGSDMNAGSEVLVFRQTDGKRAAAKFDLDDIRAGKVDDPPLQSGDVVVVPTSVMKETFNNFVKVSPILNVFRFF